jgi:TRAP-type mannitol/chloroaromatic compound transport system substrate-binding protein
LSKENKAIVECAAAFAHTDMQAEYDVKNPAALTQLVAAGTKLFAFPQPVMQAAFAESQALYSELSASNPDWKKIWDDLSAFRRAQNQWFRFSESTFDRFMQAQRL